MGPDRVHFVDGSAEEAQEMINGMVQRGTLIKLDEAKRPNSCVLCVCVVAAIRLLVLLILFGCVCVVVGIVVATAAVCCC